MNVSVTTKTQRLITRYFTPSPGRNVRKPNVNLRLVKKSFRKKYADYSDCLDLTGPGCAIRAMNGWVEFEVYVIANDSYVKVGEAILDEDNALEYIEINEGYRRMGLGSRLIRFIQKRLQIFHVFGGTLNRSRYNLTADGRALIQSCVRKGYLNHGNVLEDSGPHSPE